MSTVTYQIKTTLGTSLPLTGEGEEWIIDAVSGELIAKFWNGNLMTHSSLTLSQGSAALTEESTLVLTQEAA